MSLHRLQNYAAPSLISRPAGPASQFHPSDCKVHIRQALLSLASLSSRRGETSNLIILQSDILQHFMFLATLQADLENILLF